MSLSDSDVTFVDTRYGKNYVRLLCVKRNGKRHDVKELEVGTKITLNDNRDYLVGDNAKIVATDSQKNTVYVLAKKYGVKSIEEFGMRLCDHFLRQYDHVTDAYIYIEEKPWTRVQQAGKSHNHAFMQAGGATRFCRVEQHKHAQPHVWSGLKDLQVMKTTQSAFVNFVNDEYRTLPDMDDRVFSTIVQATWDYNTIDGLNFDEAWQRAYETIIEVFAGPADTGVYSPSVQKTLYDTQKLILSRIKQANTIEIVLPNVHAYEFDFSKFKKLNITNDGEVFQPTDKPSGNIGSKVQRRYKAKL